MRFGCEQTNARTEKDFATIIYIPRDVCLCLVTKSIYRSANLRTVRWRRRQQHPFKLSAFVLSGVDCRQLYGICAETDAEHTNVCSS